MNLYEQYFRLIEQLGQLVGNALETTFSNPTVSSGGIALVWTIGILTPIVVPTFVCWFLWWLIWKFIPRQIRRFVDYMTYAPPSGPQVNIKIDSLRDPGARSFLSKRERQKNRTTHHDT
jgi:hypothetical protein